MLANKIYKIHRCLLTPLTILYGEKKLKKLNIYPFENKRELKIESLSKRYIKAEENISSSGNIFKQSLVGRDKDHLSAFI